MCLWCVFLRLRINQGYNYLLHCNVPGPHTTSGSKDHYRSCQPLWCFQRGSRRRWCTRGPRTSEVKCPLCTRSNTLTCGWCRSDHRACRGTDYHTGCLQREIPRWHSGSHTWNGWNLWVDCKHCYLYFARCKCARLKKCFVLLKTSFTILACYSGSCQTVHQLAIDRDRWIYSWSSPGRPVRCHGEQSSGGHPWPSSRRRRMMSYQCKECCTCHLKSLQQIYL